MPRVEYLDQEIIVKSLEIDYDDEQYFMEDDII